MFANLEVFAGEEGHFPSSSNCYSVLTEVERVRRSSIFGPLTDLIQQTPWKFTANHSKHNSVLKTGLNIKVHHFLKKQINIAICKDNTYLDILPL